MAAENSESGTTLRRDWFGLPLTLAASLLWLYAWLRSHTCICICRGHGEYDSLWQGLRREFDLSDRFDILQTKLDLLRDSHPFFLQVIHALQGHRMEIIIIALIAIEVVLGLLELYHRYA